MSSNAIEIPSRKSGFPLWIVGVGLAHGALVTGAWATFNSQGIRTVPHIYAWVAAGGITLGALSGYFFYRSDLLGPLFILTGSLCVSTVSTWTYYESLGNAAAGTFPQLLWVHGVLWPLVLAVMLLFGGTEKLVRDRVTSP